MVVVMVAVVVVVVVVVSSLNPLDIGKSGNSQSVLMLFLELVRILVTYWHCSPPELSSDIFGGGFRLNCG